ncbi:hypothetical protein I305_04233 [Cryptococcus gattii E566]|uniref:Uncharacterized protein n=2 Tax=Cryptococcus gattii TaxID=37769 RepID=E6R2Y4_CRYGW|nr:Hypothetical Protein CGB_C2140W [Cryptococcus gattii WM276]ADV20862.1 Hypothetical Protein CGB_C2140W [Cryptococcus gattii WM276]KIR82336.1 hypothetical protein I306_00663 [Cryptococcus gattii EJB2]KIY33365.1 hypothetical protein I305_04233 [Cryptococcus gattii E566]KJE01595.1 hypothetical protein I311_04757 [Cryptococcus gattii NT-10]
MLEQPGIHVHVLIDEWPAITQAQSHGDVRHLNFIVQPCWRSVSASWMTESRMLVIQRRLERSTLRSSRLSVGRRRRRERDVANTARL